MDEHATRIETLNLVGGRLCLDFANTVSAHGPEHPNERLMSYGDLLRWSRHAAILTEPELEELARAAAVWPAEAAGVFEQAWELRETIYHIFSAVAAGRPATPEDLERLNAILRAAMAHVALAQTDDGFLWDWEPGDGALDRMIWPIVRSAADLLTSGDIGRVRECSGDTCGWLFVDTSRNRSRRWCDMEDCGNRAKARRHYQRKRAGEPAGT